MTRNHACLPPTSPREDDVRALRTAARAMDCRLRTARSLGRKVLVRTGL